MRKILFLFLVLVCMYAGLYSQSCANATPNWKSDITGTCGQMVMTMAHDVKGKPYLYVANKEGGLRIYDIQDNSTPKLKKTIATSAFDSLDVMSLYQQDNYVYLALGNHFSKNQKCGFAIVKVDTPENASVTAHWSQTGSLGGSGVIRAEGNYVYLGAMGNGLFIFDVSDKKSIKYKSKLIPDIQFPTSGPNPDLYNARGMSVLNGIVYLCYDAGGIRIINTSDKNNPKETGRFSNPLLNGKPRAYNNCILRDSLLYVAVDYCGLEILNIKDTSKIFIQGKWNPYNCPANNWFASPVHANEIELDANCNVLFISTGKSDMHVVNVADPSHPDSCNVYGGIGNNIGSWGVNIYANEIYISYICAIIPFSSNWTGVKILEYTGCTNGIHIQERKAQFYIAPNPVNEILHLTPVSGITQLKSPFVVVRDALGKLIFQGIAQNKGNEYTLDLIGLPSGIYTLEWELNDWKQLERFVLE